MKNDLDKIVIIGKTSYIGLQLHHFFEIIGEDVISLSSKECNLLSFDQVRDFFKSLGNSKITIIFLAVISKSLDNKFEDYVNNITLIKNFIEAQKLANLKYIIYLSSVDVYGRNPKLPITEESKLDPDTLYGLAKQTSEWMLIKSANVRCPVAVLRIPGIYGCGFGDKSIISKMISEIEKGVVTIYGDGKTQRDYVYVGDLCWVIHNLISIRHQGILNVVTGHSTNMLELSKIIQHSLQKNTCIIQNEKNAERSFDLVFDNSLLRSILPKFKFSSLDFGIQTYI